MTPTEKQLTDACIREGLERAAKAATQACWRHEGEDAYSKGMDAGAIHQAEACAAAIRALIVPTDMVVVPREPTEAMMNAGFDAEGHAISKMSGSTETLTDIYRAMINAKE